MPQTADFSICDFRKLARKWKFATDPGLIISPAGSPAPPLKICDRFRKVALLTEQPPLGTPTVGALQPVWVEVAFQPDRADAIIQQFSNWEVNHIPMIPHA